MSHEQITSTELSEHLEKGCCHGLFRISDTMQYPQYIFSFVRSDYTNLRQLKSFELRHFVVAG